VKTVEARDFWREVDVSPKNQGYHYNRNAETYMEVGNALGWAMAELLKKQDKWTGGRPGFGQVEAAVRCQHSRKAKHNMSRQRSDTRSWAGESRLELLQLQVEIFGHLDKVDGKLPARISAIEGPSDETT
jgi:hypothetical protein